MKILNVNRRNTQFEQDMDDMKKQEEALDSSGSEEDEDFITEDPVTDVPLSDLVLETSDELNVGDDFDTISSKFHDMFPDDMKPFKSKYLSDFNDYQVDGGFKEFNLGPEHDPLGGGFKHRAIKAPLSSDPPVENAVASLSGNTCILLLLTMILTLI